MILTKKPTVETVGCYGDCQVRESGSVHFFIKSFFCFSVLVAFPLRWAVLAAPVCYPHVNQTGAI
jgi:hypothetical protein